MAFPPRPSGGAEPPILAAIARRRWTSLYLADTLADGKPCATIIDRKLPDRGDGGRRWAQCHRVRSEFDPPRKSRRRQRRRTERL